MRVLFLHNNFPAQYRHIATALAADPANQVVFVTKNTDVNLAGIQKVVFAPSREAHPSTHHYVRSLESAVLEGQAVYRVTQQLKDSGFVPDVICGHVGWGNSLFIKDVFPDVPFLCYMEWFYHARGTDADFDPEFPLDEDDVLRIRIKNASVLLNLASCDWGMSPTYWQRSQCPPEFHSRISVLHDGIDTDYFKPDPGYRLVLPGIIDLSHVDEVITYVARGMEPYRGFPQFIESIDLILKRRPNCHVVVVAADRVAYGRALDNGMTYKEWMLKKVPLDLSRVHFIGTLPYGLYKKVLHASAAHIYLTRPFVLSWSMLEAMASGCLVVASDTQPVTEVIRDRENGLLVDFFSPEQVADRVDAVLDHPDRMQAVRDRARQTILERYDLAKLLPQHLQLITDLANGTMARWRDG